MKYTFETQRTYVTEVTIVADSREEAWAWVYENGQTIAEAELEQMNVVHEESIMRVQEPSEEERNVYDMLDTLDVVMDEFKQLYNDARMVEMREYYREHMGQLKNITNLIKDCNEQAMLKLLAEYSDVREDIFKITEDYYDVMGYDIEGWYEFIVDGDYEDQDLQNLTHQVASSRALLEALSSLNYKFS
jgi:hypothetical protein